MDRRTEWPWSWEEEAEWKAELEEREYDFVGEMIDAAVEEGVTSARFADGPGQEEESAEDSAPERYLVTA